MTEVTEGGKGGYCQCASVLYEVLAHSLSHGEVDSLLRSGGAAQPDSNNTAAQAGNS